MQKYIENVDLPTVSISMENDHYIFFNFFIRNQLFINVAQIFSKIRNCHGNFPKVSEMDTVHGQHVDIILNANPVNISFEIKMDT